MEVEVVIKVDREGRKLYSAECKAAMIAKHQSSGLSRPGFCRREGIALYDLYSLAFSVAIRMRLEFLRCSS